MQPFPLLKRTTLGIAAAVLILGTPVTHAAVVSVPLTNGSFDANVGGPGGITGWTGGFVSLDHAPYLITPDGGNFAFVFDSATYGSTSLAWSMSQTTAYTIHEGDIFDLTVAIGNDSGGGPNLTSFYTGLIQLIIDGNTVASFTGNSTPIPSAGFLDVSFQYTAVAGDEGKLIGIRLGDVTGATSGGYYDNVRLTVDAAPVPEPATTALLGIGAVTALAMARRKRRQAK